MKQFGGLPCFVGLEMADHVPAGLSKIAQVVDFPREFLHTVFAEVADSSFVRLSNPLCGKRLAHRHQSNFARVAASPHCGVPNSLLHPGNVFENRHKAINHEEHKVTRRKTSILGFLRVPSCPWWLLCGSSTA